MNITGNLLLPSSVAHVSSLFHFIEGTAMAIESETDANERVENGQRVWGDCSCRSELCVWVWIAWRSHTYQRCCNSNGLQTVQQETIIAFGYLNFGLHWLPYNWQRSIKIKWIIITGLSEPSNVRARHWSICDRLLYWIHWYWLFVVCVCVCINANAVQMIGDCGNEDDNSKQVEHHDRRWVI